MGEGATLVTDYVVLAAGLVALAWLWREPLAAWWHARRMKPFDWEESCPELVGPPPGHVYRVVVVPHDQQYY